MVKDHIYHISNLYFPYNFEIELIQQQFCFHLFICNKKTLMSTQEGSSHTKSSKPTMRNTNSPFMIGQESSILSLNIEDLRELMKKKEKEYQAELLIDDAKRVHGFLNEVQEQQRQKEERAKALSKRRQKKSVQQYNNQTMAEFQDDWKKSLEETVKQIEEACVITDQQHDAQLEKAQQRIEEAANGKGLERLKFSRTVLQMEDQLLRLVKLQEYDQAQVVNKRLQKCKKQQISQFLRKSVEKERRSLETMKIHHKKQKELLNCKFNKIITEEELKRGKEMDRLVKNIHSFQVDPRKVESRINRRLKEKSKGKESEAIHNSAFKKVQICQAALDGKNTKDA